MEKLEKIPQHVAIIMDGNGRWAKMRGKKRTDGHLEGSKTLEYLALHAIKRGVKVLSVFAFSTDNFNRSQEEIDYLMNLFVKFFKTKMKRILEENIRVVFSGSKEDLRKDVIEAMEKIVEKTKNNTKGTLNICLNYGGQEEIIYATKRIIEEVNKHNLDIEKLDKKTFYRFLYQDLPPIDLLIRTSGELRISNFMLYQMSYAEMYFTNTYFPDFKEEELDKALDSYKSRDRRFGRIKEEK